MLWKRLNSPNSIPNALQKKFAYKSSMCISVQVTNTLENNINQLKS